MYSFNKSILLTVFLGLWLAGLAAADFTFGDLKSSYTSSSTLELTWKITDSDPKESELKPATFLICTGSNNDIDCPETAPELSEGKGTSGLAAMNGKLNIDLSKIASVGDDGPYFIQMAAAGGQFIMYTERFKLTGMKGSKKATDGGDTSPPPPTIKLGALTPEEISSQGKLPYTQQTGRTRVAPMQMQPGTTVTRPFKASRRFPTSAVTYFTSQHAPAAVVSTITPGWSYTFSALTNSAKTQAQPTKFYAASAAIKSSILAHSKAPKQPSSK